MHELPKATAHGASKQETYHLLIEGMGGLLAGERDWLVNTANVSAWIYQMLPQLNWAGFYFLRGGELVLGPFQGKVACGRIALGKGVCGAAAVRRQTVGVADVHAFPGHIACDAASESEIVVPIILHGGRLVGVLDLDSPVKGRFDEVDREHLERVVGMLATGTDWDHIG
jgi:GAF domain-containing protein